MSIKASISIAEALRALLLDRLAGPFITDEDGCRRTALMLERKKAELGLADGRAP